jgi:ATP-dependent helicase/nuclease subunit B
VARFRGVIDRIDRRTDGEAVVVDYKTGKVGPRSPYVELAEDPVVRGTKVQLALYAEAVRQQHGGERPISHYWFATSAGGFTPVGYPYTPERQERFRQVVDHAVRDIEAGVFPARPGEPASFWGSYENCNWCDFDELCPQDRHEQWTALADSPETAAYRALAEPRDESDSEQVPT